ncbi:MAG TPA: asparagine synthase (glutamine-hydrolyzing) [Opitutaceae bacterium]|jgi:asparagine synthase (glutamine-hydrolysing)|nr:asparagine synthase (glutamine-hydrolyzing) [Opitutaceae bacterium]
MCGIAGFVGNTDAPAAREAAVLRMCAAMWHRGPDDDGLVTQGEATIGMRRLAIFDPANGHQPMATADGRFHLVFNGAIYNHRELRAELESTGYAFKTRCDTEVLLAAFARWGESCLPRLRGMFAFAVWDTRLQNLFLARDAFGIKPLYLHHAGPRLLFASELNALLTSGAVSTEIDPQAVADYLAWFAVPAPRTIWRGITTLRPGECATFHAGQVYVRSWWTFQKIPDKIKPCATREDFIQELRAKLEDTIRAHLLADVPVGAFLSGGLDSSVIVGLMQRAGAAQIKTFSIGFDEGEFSEAAFAQRAARHFGTEHHASVLTGRQVAADLEKILASLDQPTGDGINTYYVSRAAHAGGVTAALSGLGGDELFGGYPSFRDIPRLARWLPLWQKLPTAVRNPVLAGLARRGVRARKLADFLRHARDAHGLAALQRRVFSSSAGSSLLHPDLQATLAVKSPHHPQRTALAAELTGAGLFELISAWESRTYMADVLLRDSDVMSMRHSLELRVPFVDRPLFEWLWRQPAQFKDGRAHPKSVLAAAVADVLPPETLRRKKQGFTLPFPVWMRRELRPFLDETFSTASLARSNLFATGTAQDLWKNFLTGTDTREWSRVWSLAVLVTFANRRLLFQSSHEPTPVVS